jgi:diamine N-acetyltransferase
VLETLSFERLNSTGVSHEQLHSLVAVSQQTFVETFGAVYTEADATHYLKERLSLKRLEWEVSEEPNTFFYLIRVNQQVVGYLKTIHPCHRYLDEAALPFSLKHPTLLERFYFVKNFQGQGLAPVALQFTLSLAKVQQGSDFMYLTVWENNGRARRFYEKAGFTIVGSTEYRVGEQADLDYVYGLTL